VTPSIRQSIRLKNPSSPEYSRAEEEAERGANQEKVDRDALDKRAAQLVEEEREYKRQLLLVILAGLEELATAKGNAAEEMAPMGEELAAAGAEVPDVGDPRRVDVQTELRVLRDEKTQQLQSPNLREI
jgi:hypothetical protein